MRKAANSEEQILRRKMCFKKKEKKAHTQHIDTCKYIQTLTHIYTHAHIHLNTPSICRKKRSIG